MCSAAFWAAKAAGSVMLEKSVTIDCQISAGDPKPAGAAAAIEAACGKGRCRYEHKANNRLDKQPWSFTLYIALDFIDLVYGTVKGRFVGWDL